MLFAYLLFLDHKFFGFEDPVLFICSCLCLAGGTGVKVGGFMSVLILLHVKFFRSPLSLQNCA